MIFLVYCIVNGTV